MRKGGELRGTLDRGTGARVKKKKVGGLGGDGGVVWAVRGWGGGGGGVGVPLGDLGHR